jgi:cytochrome c-type biogenesis protein CcmH/NrfG
MWRSGIDALREGRFGDAASALQECYRLRPRAQVAIVIALARVVNNGIGRAVYRCARSAWSRRPWKYRPAGNAQ